MEKDLPYLLKETNPIGAAIETDETERQATFLYWYDLWFVQWCAEIDLETLSWTDLWDKRDKEIIEARDLELNWKGAQDRARA